MNSEPIGEAQASVNPAILSTKYIGRANVEDDYFVGDIYEILHFNAELSSEECIHVSSDLMKKYGISEIEREPRVLSGLVPEED